MDNIVPVRTVISDRFPVASFAVRCPDQRVFEVACATDPRLFHTAWRNKRNRSNFYTTRGDGLYQAPRGETMWMIPPDQLRRFAGAERVFYALATYGGPRGEQPRFTISPDALHTVPSIALSPDFTGRALDRMRIGAVEPATYGGDDNIPLAWGGDDALEAEQPPSADPQGYDDGYGGELWEGSEYRGQDDLFEEPPAEGMEGSYDDDPGQEGHAEAYGVDEDSVENDPAACNDGIPMGQGLGDEPDEPESDGQALGEEEEAGEHEGYGYPGTPISEHELRYGNPEDEVPAAEAEGWAEDLASGDPGGDSPEEDPAAVWGRAGERWEEYEADDVPARASEAEALVARPLDIVEKVRLIRRVARPESGSDTYAAINADTEYNNPRHRCYRQCHIGLSWGLIQFTQRSGNLGQVLTAVKRRSDGNQRAGAPSFEELFGPDAAKLLTVTNAETGEARVAPVGGTPLWQEPWLGRFRRAGNLMATGGGASYVQAAQNEVAVTRFLDPILPLCRWLDLHTPRGVAIVLDRVIHMGRTGGIRWIMEQVGGLDTEERRASALRALGHHDLKSFQRTISGLRADNAWGPWTHAALIGALRAAGQPGAPRRADVLDAIERGARSKGFATRVADLIQDRTDLDDGVTYTE